jgi:hypothetical protein
MQLSQLLLMKSEEQGVMNLLFFNLHRFLFIANLRIIKVLSSLNRNYNLHSIIIQPKKTRGIIIQL